MKEMLLNRLHEIEKEKDVKILLASESGSRSWGFASKDSDYDVRFIYVNKLPWYLSVTDRRDVIESMSENKLFDYAGWDIAKALNLFRSTNPTMLEWLHSPFVYYRDEEFASRLGAMEEQYFNPKKALHHYYGMSQNCYKSMGRERDFKMKPFLYHLRGLLACRWIETFAAAPPVPFAELVAATIKEEDVRSEISMLVALKAESNEYNAMPVVPLLADYAKALESYYQSNINGMKFSDRKQPSDEELNRLNMDMIMKYSHDTIQQYTK